MVLKGFRLWAMGQLDSSCRAPPRALEQRRPRCSGTRWKLKSKGLKPVSHSICSRVETGRAQARGSNWIRVVPPCHVKVVKSTERAGIIGTDRSERSRMEGWQHIARVMSCSSISGRPLTNPPSPPPPPLPLPPPPPRLPSRALFIPPRGLPAT
jgi:hypothetical protein